LNLKHLIYDFTRIKKAFFFLLLFFSACYFEPQPKLYINPSATLAPKDSGILSSRSSPRRPRRSSRSRYRSSVTVRDDTRDVQEELSARNFDLNDYFDGTVYIYSNLQHCQTSQARDDNKTCLDNCGDTSCIDQCLESNGCEVWISYGSGVFISNSEVLTNHHVMEEALNREWTDRGFWGHLNSYVESYSGTKTLVERVKWYEEDDDVALIELNNPVSTVFIPPHGATGDLEPLTEVFTIGNPTNFKWTISKGWITNIDSTRFPRGISPNFIFHSIPTGGGNSGGGVFTFDGKLVGLIAVRLRDTSSRFSFDNLAGGAHIDRIKDLISSEGGTTGPNLLTRSQTQLTKSQERSYIENLEGAFAEADILE